MALWIKANGEQQEVHPAGKRFTLAELQQMVGGSIEIISTGSRLYILDEEGKLKGKPHNVAATHRAHDFLWPGDWLAGDVVICEESELPE